MTSPTDTRSRRFGDPLFVIAGVTREAVVPVGREIRKLYAKKCDVCGTAFGRDVNKVYNSNNVETLFWDVARHVLCKEGEDSNSKKVSPGKIVLLFSEGGGLENLLNQFQFFAFPVRIRIADRRFINFITNGFRIGFEDFLENPYSLNFVEDQIHRKFKKTPLLLPGTNFINKKDKKEISYAFRKVLNGDCSWDELSKSVETKTFLSEDFPRFPIKKNKFVGHIDQRKLIFPGPPPFLWEGQDWDLPDDVWNLNLRSKFEERAKRIKLIQLKLNELYRFGFPVAEGFHYDVQKRRNSRIKNLTFICAKDGPKKPVDTHINIYPNDYVRP